MGMNQSVVAFLALTLLVLACGEAGDVHNSIAFCNGNHCSGRSRRDPDQ